LRSCNDVARRAPLETEKRLFAIGRFVGHFTDASQFGRQSPTVRLIGKHSDECFVHDGI
jgi:hypothetical protein